MTAKPPGKQKPPPLPPLTGQITPEGYVVKNNYRVHDIEEYVDTHEFIDPTVLMDTWSRESRFGSLHFITGLSDDRRFPREYPKEPVLRREPPRGISYFEHERAFDQEFRLLLPQIVRLRHEFAVLRWERDEARHAAREMERRIDATVQDRLREQEKQAESRILMWGDQIHDLQTKLAAKKELECIHGDDIMVDHAHWQRMQRKLKGYRNVALGATVVAVLMTVLRCFG